MAKHLLINGPRSSPFVGKSAIEPDQTVEILDVNATTFTFKLYVFVDLTS